MKLLKIIAVIQARMGSTRLPGKVLKRLSDKTVIEHIVERLKKCNDLDEVIVATSLSAENKELINLLSKNNIKMFLGSEEDVLDRFVNTGQYYDADILVRVTGDNPLTCPVCIDKMIESHLSKKAHYTTMNNLPLGVGSEIVNMGTLIGIKKRKLECYHKEHVTLYIRENNMEFDTNLIEAPIGYNSPELRLTVDTIEDFELIQNIYRVLYRNNEIINIPEVIEYLKDNHEILNINRNVKQKGR
ncbi:hypothetical protein GCM10022323_05980 [Asaccharospora irregularis DSM 2635]